MKTTSCTFKIETALIDKYDKKTGKLIQNGLLNKMFQTLHDYSLVMPTEHFLNKRTNKNNRLNTNLI